MFNVVKRYGFIERSKLCIKSQLKMKIFYSVKYLIFCIILQSAMMLSCLKVMTILFISMEISMEITEAKVGVFRGKIKLHNHLGGEVPEPGLDLPLHLQQGKRSAGVRLSTSNNIDVLRDSLLSIMARKDQNKKEVNTKHSTLCLFLRLLSSLLETSSQVQL